MGVIGILSDGPGIPCVECPDSPKITVGNPTTLLSSNNDNPPSTEFFQNIRSVREVSVTREFFCKKEDFDAVKTWLVGLDGRSLVANVGENGKKLIAGDFKLSGQITSQSHSPSLAKVSAEWTAYVLDCNITVAPSISFRKDSDTQWTILCGNSAVLTVNSSSIGDGTGLLFDAGETVSWESLPADVKASAQQYEDDLPTTPEECEAIGKNEYVAWFTKWRALRLKCNGEVCLTWWVRVSSNANAVDNTRALRLVRVYYGMTRAEGTDGDGDTLQNIQGPLDITKSSNTRLATDPELAEISTTYSGNGMANLWAFRPEISIVDANAGGESGAYTTADSTAYSNDNNVSSNVTNQSASPVSAFNWAGVKYLVSHSSSTNVWAFPAYYGDSKRSKRFTTAGNVLVRMTGYEYTAGEHAVPGAVKLVYSTVATYNAADTLKKNETTQTAKPTTSYAASPSVSIKTSADGTAKYLTPQKFMAWMENRINDWLDTNNYIESSADLFHYDISWTSTDKSFMRLFHAVPSGVVNPVYIDLDALNSQQGFNPTSSIQSSVPTLLKALSLAKKTTNTSSGASFSEKGCYSGKDTWTKTDNGATYTITYEEVFKKVLTTDSGITISEADATPANFGFYAVRQTCTRPGGAALDPTFESWGLVGYVFKPETFNRQHVAHGIEESIVNVFWREDDASVALLANNALGNNPLLTFSKTGG